MSVSPITNGAGSIAQNGRVKLWYHHDRLGSTDYLTDNVTGKVTSYVTYDSWGDPAMKAILKLGVRELDLVTEYTGHMYDPVLGVLTGHNDGPPPSGTARFALVSTPLRGPRPCEDVRRRKQALHGDGLG